jgi:hypothetical protein
MKVHLKFFKSSLKMGNHSNLKTKILRKICQGVIVVPGTVSVILILFLSKIPGTKCSPQIQSTKCVSQIF